jgi:two-component system CheB/CheR fusion protein
LGDNQSQFGQGLNSLRVRFTLMVAVLGTLIAAIAALWFSLGIQSQNPVLLWLSTAGLLTSIMAAAGLTYVMTGNLTRPIESLRASTEAIARGDLDAPVSVECNCEVGGLADSFKAMVARLNANVSRIHTLAYEDGITGLPNRTVLDDVLSDVGRLRGGGILFIDLDRFKQVNDLFGHQVGDNLLRRAAQRMLGQGLGMGEEALRTCFSGIGPVAEQAPDGRMLFRFAGDEFVALVPGPVSGGELCDIAGRLIDSLRAPFLIDGQKLEIGCSIGIARIGVDSDDASELSKFADQAMYEAKRSGRNRYVLFNEELRAAVHDRSELERDLSQAVDNGEIRVHYQPKFSIEDETIAGVEALVRWQHPTRGLLGPGTFLDIAEAKGLLDKIGREVFRLSAVQLHHWRSSGFDTRIAINVCPSQFLNPAFAANILSFARELGVEPRDFVLEITETVAMSDSLAADDQVRRLKEAGFGIAIDDFGIGYSNLSQLYKLKFDSLKIDKSLIDNIDTDVEARRIVAFSIGMAHDLGQTVVAEGIERRQQLDVLAALHCDYIQGFLLGRPMPGDAVQAAFAQPRDFRRQKLIASIA